MSKILTLQPFVYKIEVYLYGLEILDLLGVSVMTETVLSKHGIPIRLTDERWAHIIEEHCELAGMRLEVLNTVANPLRIVTGHGGELLAFQEVESGKYLVVAYRELTQDGFIITAFLTRRIQTLNRRTMIWPA